MQPCPTLPLTKAEAWLTAENLAPFNWVVDSRTSSKSLIREGRTSTAAISVHFDYSDSMCSDTYGPIRATEIYYRGPGFSIVSGNVAYRNTSLQVFYGPCCKYVLASFGKFTKYWGVPLITPGGMISAFSNKGSFMMTRFIAPYDKVLALVKALLAKYNWWHVSFMFHDTKHDEHGRPMCLDIANSVANPIDRKLRMTANDDSASDKMAADSGDFDERCCWVYRDTFEEDYYDYNLDDRLNQIRNKSRGKLTRTCLYTNVR